MRHKFILFGFTFIFLLSLFCYPLKLDAFEEIVFPNPEATISMDFQDANLKDILKIFSIQSGLNFVASEAVQDRKITLYLDKVLIKNAMDKLFQANNLSYDLEKESNIFIVKDWGRPQTETITKIFHLKYATVSSSPLRKEISDQLAAEEGEGGGGGEEDTGITKAVEKVLSEYGSVIEEPRTNSLIITDIPSKMPIVSQLISSLDLPTPQVLLEVEMLDVNKNITDKIGFDFSSAGSYSIQVVSASRATTFPLSAWANKEILSNPVTVGTLGFPTTLKLALDFLRTQSDTKYLARPRILTLNNETAEIKITTDESIGITTTTTSAQGTGTTTVEPERAETGVTLRVTPQINTDSGEITMFIYPQVSEATRGNSFIVGGSNYQYRDPETRSTKSTVRIKDGDTVIIGGLIRNEFSNIITKLPILGDIPLLGALFKHKNNDRNKERELLVFITPHIIKETAQELAQAKKISIPEREQSTSSITDRQDAIKNTLDTLNKRR